MKEKFLTFVITCSFLFAFNNLYSQSGWFQQVSNTTQVINSIFLVNQNTGYFTTLYVNNLYATTNGGNNWDLIYIFPVGQTVNKLFFIDANTGFGMSGTYFGKTTNGGVSWTQITVPPNASTNFQFLNVNTGFIGGTVMAKTINSGNNWITYLHPHLNGGFGQFYFLNSYTGFSISSYPGYSGIAKTTSGGESWDFKYLDTIPLVSLSKPLGNYMYATSTRKVFRSTTGGNSWNLVHTFDYQLAQIVIADSLVAYILARTTAGSGGYVLKTTNGGYDWNTQLTTSSVNTLTSISFANPQVGNVGGSEGTIYRTNTGGVLTNIINPITISKYELSQNYPNPFNPSTNIKFDIPKSSFVRISVFDISGREVEVLVNEKLHPGTYQSEWNGSNYSSGVYFYRIETDNFRETKSMLLIK